MNYKFSLSFLFVFSFVVFNSVQNFAVEKTLEEEGFTELFAELKKISDKFKQLAFKKSSNFSEKFYLDLENKLKDKFSSIEENLFDLCTKEDLDVVFNQEDYNLLLNFLSQRYQAVINAKDDLSFKSYIQNIKKTLGLLEINNTKLEDLKKDNLKLETQIVNLQKNILNLQIGLATTAIVCIGYGVYQYYNKADNK